MFIIAIIVVSAIAVGTSLKKYSPFNISANDNCDCCEGCCGFCNLDGSLKGGVVAPDNDLNCINSFFKSLNFQKYEGSWISFATTSGWRHWRNGSWPSVIKQRLSWSTLSECKYVSNYRRWAKQREEEKVVRLIYLDMNASSHNLDCFLH